ncbi:MAG TPA: NAD(P)-binding protein [Methylocella sp.]|nr:NAD(P)-binding protein [Methylocella sp.]
MPTPNIYRALGMDRPITRRDFLNGAAVSISASLIDLPALGDPPQSDYLGQTDQSAAVMHALRDGRFWQNAGSIEEIGEQYDLIVVGAGISGLAAAFLYQQQAGHDTRVLILESASEFGGHAIRNEFAAKNGRRIIGYGGSESLQTPSYFSPAVAKLISDIGMDLSKFKTWFDQNFDERHGLGEGVFFAREIFGQDALVRKRGGDAEWIAQTPLTEKAKSGLIALYEKPSDPLAGFSREAKLARLATLTYEAFLLETLRLDAQVAAFFADTTKGYFGAGIDAVSCLDARSIGNPGFAAMDLGDGVYPALSPSGRLNQKNPDPYIYHFPDGNASLARALVRYLIPEALPGSSVEDLLLAETRHEQLDSAGNKVRLRLNASCVKIGQKGEGVEALYASDGRVYKVVGAHAVLACWHRVIPLIASELPAVQREALDDQNKVPLIYANVLLRSWEALSKLAVARFSVPGGWFEECSLDFPVSIGNYRFAERADEPILLHLSKTVLSGKGEPAREQSRAGRLILTSLSFAEAEFRIRDLLSRALEAGDFDPARDIEAITINRWSHGYAYEYMKPWDAYWPSGPLPIETSRRVWGKVAIANSDAGAYAYANSAIDQAARAVRELLGTPDGAPAYASFPGPPLDKIGQ